MRCWLSISLLKRLKTLKHTSALITSSPSFIAPSLKTMTSATADLKF